ncbi:MAG: hypothetical protein LCH61_03555 [Proteobacteria bacterium]|nr:hypothetical protein [Pseudomonadota bacterium]
MTILGGFAAGMFTAQRNAADLRDLRNGLNDLNRQLATGRRSETLGGITTGRSSILALRAERSALDSYAGVAQRGNLRIGMMTGALEHITGIAREARTTAMNAGMTPESQRTAIFAARTGLESVISQLNSDFDGQFLFSGRATATEPVASAASILDGEAGADGLRTLIAERRAADAGTGLGRLMLNAAGADVALSEETAGLPFGLKPGVGGGTGGISVAGPVGAPSGIRITTTNAVVGDSLTLNLTLPDGNSVALNLTARAADSTGPANTFAIGADDVATAANLAGALDGMIRDVVNTTMAGASSAVAAEDFFAGTASTPARRIAGPSFETATGYAAAGSRATVQWYRGDDAPGDPRATQVMSVDRGMVLGVGARANEAPLRRVLAGFAMTAVETGNGLTAQQNAVLEKSRSLLVQDGIGAVSGIATDLSQAGANMKAASTRHAQRGSLIDGMLADIEQPSLEEVSASILSLQTRLQASYQVTASLSRLNLSEYL